MDLSYIKRDYIKSCLRKVIDESNYDLVDLGNGEYLVEIRVSAPSSLKVNDMLIESVFNDDTPYDTRALNVLMESGVAVLSDLEYLSVQDLSLMKGVGRSTVLHIKDRAREYGIDIK